MALSSAAIQLGSTRREEELPPGAPWYKHVFRAWKKLGRAIGNLLSRIVTTLSFFLILPFFAVFARPLSDPLQLKPGPARTTPLPKQPSSVEEARGGI